MSYEDADGKPVAPDGAVVHFFPPHRIALAHGFLAFGPQLHQRGMHLSEVLRQGTWFHLRKPNVPRKEIFTAERSRQKIRIPPPRLLLNFRWTNKGRHRTRLRYHFVYNHWRRTSGSVAHVLGGLRPLSKRLFFR